MTSPVVEQLKLSDFDYDLPESLIAQEPALIRDRSRLMVVHRNPPGLLHGVFSDIGEHLVPGDLLVLNDTRVFPCRLPARKPGGGRAEIFLVSECGTNSWEALVKGEGRKGARLTVGDGIKAEISGEGTDGLRRVHFSGVEDIRGILPRLGKTPLPPYIRHEPSGRDSERYQTVYASHEGAVAAPTAGLHFTPELIERLKNKGVEFVFVTLHVGPGTFQPVRKDNIAEHRMLPERYELTADSADAVNRAKRAGRRVIAVGTTSVRTLETATLHGNEVSSGSGTSTLYIRPGYRFRVIDGLVTNFHLPKSTLLMLVSALAGRETILAAYRTAVEEKYRFYSYGDAMLVL